MINKLLDEYYLDEKELEKSKNKDDLIRILGKACGVMTSYDLFLLGHRMGKSSMTQNLILKGIGNGSIVSVESGEETLVIIKKNLEKAGKALGEKLNHNSKDLVLLAQFQLLKEKP